ncbi:uncharacterized protein PHACADRAFT_125734 [Phanerochaete carnosa HHB-10118-sp]|uniref:Glucose-methanol-choline oxidoreductase N-terminal domain-containing protein n=1 Tax=Phanerochaete carnosa (strain HHB-10118-sp) TaxID=650164 RepID=K5UUY3_PHACS|nr:uncharacterized protein PHACADRAFT_125734 [Phanerochaete carnosa HHB-10118-sp]EKM53786.1 hypothetical protein PHACADRAFT_125734 [Phanerochaete carnosa HHB-10118-sp]
MEQKLAGIADISGKEFDFVVAGGGTAGCVVAARLSENPNISVALLEAGPAHFDDPLVSGYVGWTGTVTNPEYDWNYLTTPQRGFKGEPTIFPRGRGLGGSSQINWLIWQLPQREEMDAVGKLGNEGWNWETFHKYAKKVQRFCPPDPNERNEFKNLYKSDAVGHDGPISISFGRDSCGADAAWQRALAVNGVDTISTALDGDIAGTWKGVANVDPVSRSRAYSANGYLYPALDRPNLKVLVDAYVYKLITSEHADEVVATAVEFEHGGQVHKVFARKEVIVSAGHVAVKSPHILELSGVGDRKILEPLGIPVQLDLPSVGTNVQEHVTMIGSRIKMVEDRGLITFGMLDDREFAEKLRVTLGLKDSFNLAQDGFSFVPIQIGSERAEQLVQKQRAKFAKGDYSPGLKASYEKQLELLANPKVPDFEIFFFPSTFPIPPPEPSKPHVGIYSLVSRPFTRGTIHVQSADPKAWPAIDPHYFEEDIDMDIMVDAMKFIRKVTRTEPFKSLVVEEQLPGPNVNTDEEISAYVRKNTCSSFHTTGSMSMMPRDKGGVVDPRFRVYGTKNIRVVDLSILPIHTAVHPQATVYAIAEMGKSSNLRPVRNSGRLLSCALPTACDVIKRDYQ